MRFNKFVELANKDYEVIKKYGKREDTLFGIKLTDITFLTYDELKNQIPELFLINDFEKVIYLIFKHKKKNITFGRIKLLNNYRKFRFLLWVQDQYEKIKELEIQYLTSPPDAKLISAGIRELDILGDINLIDSLSQGDIFKWDDTRNLPYSKIFDKQLKTTIERRISKRLEEQQKQEMKRK